MKKRMNRCAFALLMLLSSGAFGQEPGTYTDENVVLSGELKKWHKVTLTFVGPETSEQAPVNPFMDYRFNVRFTHDGSGKSYTVPGYFAADGNAGETSATSGDKWRVHFAPDEVGEWSYQVEFKTDRFLAVRERKSAGKSAGFMDGYKGSFTIAPSDKTGRDNRSKGRLQYDGTRYLKFAETGEVFYKLGPDAPENFLAYADFDGNFQNDGHKDYLVKTWEPHLKDWKEGDPTWKSGKGKAMIGAINYLASKGLNSFSFLTMNIIGDDQNVFPFIDYDTYDRYDCSKLDQWETIFEYADKMGMFLHFKLMEQENQGLLDNGAIGAKTKLYYREMLARFGHHLSLNWNIGEEFGDWANDHKTPTLNTVQRLAAAEYFYQNDPYHHHVVIHCPPSFEDILGPNSKYTGVSVQTGKPDFSMVHKQVMRWIKASKEAGKQWAVSIDEPGDAEFALVPDDIDSEKNNARINGLWGAFTAGGWGTEWYFGYAYHDSDLTCQDYRSRDLFWDQCRHLLEFIDRSGIDLTKTENCDHLVNKEDYCLAEPGEQYVVVLRHGSGQIDMESYSGDFEVRWFDPRKGGKLQNGKTKRISGGGVHKLEGAPSDSDRDWVVWISRK